MSIKTFIGIPDTSIKTVMGEDVGNIKTIQGSLLNWSSYWTKHSADLDFHSDGLQADGLSLVNQVGAGGVLKQFPSLTLNDASGGYAFIKDDELLMLDETATYEYYIETILDSLAGLPPEGRGDYFCIKDVRTSVMLEAYPTGGYYLTLRDATGTSELNRIGTEYLVLGLNIISLKFNLPTKAVTITINGLSYEWTHNRTNVFDVSGNSVYVGSGYWTKQQDAVTLKIYKNDVLIKDLVLGDVGIMPAGQVYSSIPYKQILDAKTPLALGGAKSTQDLVNPYKDGYNLYLTNDSQNYQNLRVNSSLADYHVLTHIESYDIGYHIFGYIEMPNLPIFDTTDREYWKASIESDPYYVGGTAGRERWFHRSWLDFDWIDINIEDLYRGLFIIQCRWAKPAGGSYIKTKIENIVLLKNVVSYFNVRRDFYDIESIEGSAESLLSGDNSGYIATQSYSLGSKRVIVSGNFLKYSSDDGKTFNAGVDFSAIYPVNKIADIKILSNGNIVIFGNGIGIHYSDDNLSTVSAAAVKNINGTNYVFHNPVNADYPGGYFDTYNGFLENDGIVVFGNYNSANGARPVNLYYSKDYGITWIVFYTFGQNPAHTDNGTASGGVGGTPLGDVSNPLITELIHGIGLGSDGAYYAFCGESHFCIMKCVYDKINDTWSISNLLTSAPTVGAWQRMRCIGGYEMNGYIYWGADGTAADFIYNEITYKSGGIWKSLVADINDPSKHIRLSSSDLSCLGFASDLTSGKIMGVFSTPSGNSYTAPYEIHLSNDSGDTWEVFPVIFKADMIPLYYDKIKDYFIGRNLVSFQYFG